MSHCFRNCKVRLLVLNGSTRSGVNRKSRYRSSNHIIAIFHWKTQHEFSLKRHLTLLNICFSVEWLGLLEYMDLNFHFVTLCPQSKKLLIDSPLNFQILNNGYESNGVSHIISQRAKRLCVLRHLHKPATHALLKDDRELLPRMYAGAVLWGQPTSHKLGNTFIIIEKF